MLPPTELDPNEELNILVLKTSAKANHFSLVKGWALIPDYLDKNIEDIIVYVQLCRRYLVSVERLFSL